jgi:transcriptional regulator with XRE-family HTH domain
MPAARSYIHRPPGGAGPLARAVGQRIRYRRLRRRWSQPKLAEATGLSVSFISDVESGQRSMSVDSLVVFAAALDISPCRLLEDS